MTTNRKPVSIIPDLPRSKKIINTQTGEISAEWEYFFGQLILSLQNNFKPEGFVFPQQSDTNIGLLGNTFPSVGNILYDSTNNIFKGILLVSLGPPIVTTTKTFDMS